MDETPEGQADLSAYDAGSDAADRTASDGAERPASDGEATGGNRAMASADDAATTPDDAPDVRELDREERIELGVDLLAHLEAEELPLSDAVDRIETVTTNPSLTREILDTAELRGVIERDGGRIQTRRGGTFVRFESQVVRREGDFTCRRCGAGLSTGHFVRFESGQLGPFGSSCVRKVLGRE